MKERSMRGTSFRLLIFLFLAVVGCFVLPFSVHAQSEAELVEEIQEKIEEAQEILQELRQVKMRFNSDLSAGARGEKVRRLQVFLNQDRQTRLSSRGPGSPGKETDFFGEKTFSAVKRFQTKYYADVLAPLDLSNPTGFWGASSRAKANELLEGNAGEGDDSTDADDTDEEDKKENFVLKGGAGSIESAELSSTNNRTIEEGDNNREVAELKIEANEESDIMITAVKIDFDQVTATDDFDDYVEKASLSFGGKTYAEIDGEEFEDDDYSQTVSLKEGAIIRAGRTTRLEISVSSVDNIDSENHDDVWEVTFENIRFRDAQNANISDSSTGDIGGEARQFSFETSDFIEDDETELLISLSDDTPPARMVGVSPSETNEDVELLRFVMEAEGKYDIQVRDIPITLEVTGAHDVDHVVETLSIEVDGGDTYSEIPSTKDDTAVIVFDQFDFTVEDGRDVEVVVTADVSKLDVLFEEDDTLRARLTSGNVNNINAEDEINRNLGSGDKSGSASGGIVTFFNKDN